MKPSTLLFLAIAIIAGVGSLVAANKYLSTAGSNTGETFEILLAKAPIEGGQQITEPMVERARYPKSAIKDEKLAADFVTNVKDLQDLPYAAKDYASGDPIRKSGLSKNGGIAGELAKGMRAVTVKVNTAGALAGFLRRGSIVDITWLKNFRGGETSLFTILQGIKVLAVNDKMSNVGKVDNQGSMVETVTVLVTQVQSEMLAYAEKTGDIKLVMRGVEDKDFTATAGITNVDQLKTLGRKAEQELENPTDVAQDKTNIEELLKQRMAEQDKSYTAKLNELMKLVNATKEDTAKNAEELKKVDAKASKPVIVEKEKKVDPIPTVAQNTPPNTDATKTPSEPVAPKKQKFLIIRDGEGNELMRVKVKADSNVAKVLGEFIVEEDVGEAGDNAWSEPKATHDTKPATTKSGKSGKTK